MPTGQKRVYIEAKCRSCGKSWLRRSDSFKTWQGECNACSSASVSRRPELYEQHRKAGLEYVRRFGPPHSPIEKRPRGSDHYNWRGGITPERVAIWNGPEYKGWRQSVFNRDDFTCVGCGKRGGNLQADHIQPYALFPELRFEITNGRTFCIPCHRTYGACVSHGKLTRSAKIFNGTAWVAG